MYIRRRRILARNKYPEETVQKILDVSYRLFMEKGYEHTSIQDIVNAIGMSKGAIYHHFKSKDEILERICTQYYSDERWLKDILQDSSLSALEKMKQIYYYELEDEKKRTYDIIALPMMKNPNMIAMQIREGIRETAPLLAQLIEEGNADGSMQVKYPRQVAETMILLVNIWINPGCVPVSREEYYKKILFYKEMLDQLGLPLVDDAFLEICMDYYDTVCVTVLQDD
jgi:AcrR family transcriptional regulator